MFTSFLANSIGLTTVHGHLLLNETNNVRPDWGLEDCWQLDAFSRRLGLLIIDGNRRSGDHLTL